MNTMHANRQTAAARASCLFGLVTALSIALSIALAAGPAALAQGGGAAASDQLAEQTAATATGADDETLAQLLDYLNRIDTLKSRFIQVSSNGAYAEGDLYLDRPGRMRFEYDPPHPALLIANGVTLLYYDRELKQATFLPLWETPLWFLIREDDRSRTKDVELTGDRAGGRAPFG